MTGVSTADRDYVKVLYSYSVTIIKYHSSFEEEFYENYILRNHTKESFLVSESGLKGS